MQNASLEEKTLAYWNVSRAARGFGDEITTGKAITQTSDLLQYLNPQRPLWRTVACIQQEIVEHGGPKRKRKSAIKGKSFNVLILDDIVAK